MSSTPNNIYRMSSGLVHLTQLHVRQLHGSIIGTSEEAVLSGTSTVEDKSWSWKHLRNEFEAKDAEMLFKKYQIRLQHNFFMVVLMLNIFFNTVAIFAYFYGQVSHGNVTTSQCCDIVML